ncbi:MAG: branched-chain-amino-acid transaminase [Planctomycetes bacterium]|nr:branched-chain-amino-acid transaminase [Planctomycetota bacterium]
MGDNGSTKIWLNGELVGTDEARISVFDHAVLYGDGCFEGIRAYGGRVFKLASHLDRMYASAKKLRLTPPFPKDEIDRAIRTTLSANGLTDAYIRLVFTRGVGTLGLHPFRCPKPTAFVITDSIELYPPELYENGMDVIVARQRRIPIESLDPSIKSLNYLNNILAKIEAIDADVLEAIMLNVDGQVSECTGDNIFLVSDGVVITPPACAGILHGVTRRFVMEELAPALGHAVEERSLTVDDVLGADEVFLTGTAAEIIGVKRIDGHAIGCGAVGPVTRALTAEFRRRVSSNAPED